MLSIGQLIIVFFALPCFSCLIGYMIGSAERKTQRQR